MYVCIRVVRADVHVDLLVDMGPRDVLPIIFMHIYRNRAVLAQRVRLDRFLLLLDLSVLW